MTAPGVGLERVTWNDVVNVLLKTEKVVGVAAGALAALGVGEVKNTRLLAGLLASNSPYDTSDVCAGNDGAYSNCAESSAARMSPRYSPDGVSLKLVWSSVLATGR